MSVTIEVFPALMGDCFLISFGEDQKTHILIDGGMITTYKTYLKPRLIELAKKGEVLSLVIVSHIDADHIAGILELIKENGDADNPRIIPIQEIWHNSYRHIQFRAKGNKKINLFEEEILKSIVRNGLPKGSEELKQPVSAEQGSSLASLLLKGKYPWNLSFNSQAIVAGSSKIEIFNQVMITVLSPNKCNLEDLEKHWFNKLNSMRYGFKFAEDELFDDAFEFLLVQEKKSQLKVRKIAEKRDILALASEKFVEDTVLTNRSSIAVIIEYREYKLLFMGDAVPSVLLQKNELIRHNEDQHYFDLIKIAHHGSASNTSQELLNVFKGTNYLLSTNGTHGHPDIETIARIITTNKNQKKKLIFNYPIILPGNFYEPKLMEEFKFQIEQFGGDKSIVLCLDEKG